MRVNVPCLYGRFLITFSENGIDRTAKAIWKFLKGNAAPQDENEIDATMALLSLKDLKKID